VLELFNILIYYDKKLLLFIHSFSNPFWDEFWLFVTTPTHWVPFFMLLFFLLYRVVGIKKTLGIALFAALSAGVAFTIVNLIKNQVKRIRPINDTSINANIRSIIEVHDFSFVSGHSTLSFTVAFLSYWILKKRYKHAYLVFLYPILFAYSRLYLAAHFPFDILFGMLLGFVIALIFYKILENFLFKKVTV